MADEKEFDMVERANQAAQRLEEANKAREALLVREEELQKRMETLRVLGGQSSAGQPQQKEETPIEYAKRMSRGGQ